MSGRIARIDELERLPDRGPGRPHLAAGPPPLRHPGLRRQRVHAPSRRASAWSRSTARRAGTRSCTSSSPAARSSCSTARSTTRRPARSSTARPARRAAPWPPRPGRPCSGSAPSPARSSSRRAGSGRSPACRCSTRARRRPRGASSRPASRPTRTRGRATTTSPARRPGSGTATKRSKQLRRAAEIDQAVVSKYAPDDEDFASLKDDQEFLAITGQAQAGGSGS